ncbi:MAG: aldehyde ferredoxin oxidoreductase N-terminal domain-containing protein, partial [Pseudomonadota bacterium]
MHGFYNKMLRVDVGRRTYDIVELSDELLSRTMGGRGLGTHLLLELNPPKVDPLSPDNNLILTTGPLTGTAIWGSCRHGVFTKSPQTGMYSEAYSGGKAAESISATGFDAIAMVGASDTPVWLEVTPDGVVFHDADGLWGADSLETE